MSAMGNPVEAVGRFVFAPEDPRRLAALRIALFGIVAIRLATNDDYAAVAGQPGELFDPTSLFHLLPSMPSPGLTLAAQIAGVAAALLAAAGAWPRISFPSAFACALFLNLMLNATGKVVHNDLVVMLCLLPLLAAPTAATRAWSLPPRRGQARPAAAPAYGWPIRTAMIVIGLAYLFAGLQKLRYSGLDWAASDNLRYILWISSDSQAEPNSLALFVADRDALSHLLAAGALALELGFVLCLPFPRLRWVFVPGVVGLHAGIWLAMGLDYWPQVWAVLAVFVDWTRVADLVTRPTAGPLRSAPP